MIEPLSDTPGQFDVYGMIQDLKMDKKCFSYYTYYGGLTTPGCNQLVHWILVDKPLKINFDQWKNIFNMQRDDVKNKIELNFRPPMNQDEDGNPLGPPRDITHFVCPPSISCYCQSGGSFFNLLSGDMLMNGHGHGEGEGMGEA